MHMEPMESRLLMDGTTEAPGGTGMWGSGNTVFGNGSVVNASSRQIYVYVGQKAAWIPLPPGTHTPPGSDADAWTYDPTVMEGPRDPSGDPTARKIGDGHTAKAKDNAAGNGVEHDGGGSSTTTVIYPEEMSGRHPKDLPPGHNGTPDTDLDDDEDKGTDFDPWYDDPANGKKNPNKPGYQAPRPPPPVIEEGAGVLEEEDDSVLS